MCIIADFKGRENTACQTLVNLVRQRNCNLGQIQLIISWGMINRLQKVLEQDLQVSSATAKNYLDCICQYANSSPQLTLGGVGIIPLQDTEDRHVLETCLAGKGDLLVTANFQDFLNKEAQIIIDKRHAIYIAPHHSFQIVHPFLMVNWLNSGTIPTITWDN